MYRNSRLPVRKSQVLLDPGSSKRESRLSRNESRRTRASSTSRISNTLCTPSLRRSNSHASLKRTPQSVQSSRNKSAERQKVKKKDNRPIHDKKWQADMLYKTQEYFKNDPNGAIILNQGKNIRPITNTMFIQLVNVVLMNIDNDFEELTTINYVDLVPKHLSRLMYPGPITASMMKTVNTMHTWPHILAILSWLVGLHTRMQELDNFLDENMYMLPNNVSDKEYQEIKVLQLEDKCLTTSFGLWNQGKDDAVGYDSFATGLREIYGIDNREMQHWRQKVEQLNKQLEHDQNKISKQKDEIEITEEEITKLLAKKNCVETHISQQDEYIKKIKKKIEQCKEDNQKLREVSKKKEEQIKMLEDNIKLQPMTKQEKETELLRIDDLKAKRERMLKEHKHKQEISDETDIRISQLKRIIEEKVSAYNIELFKPSLKHPELKELNIKANSVLGSEFYEEVQSKTKKQEELTTELHSKLKQERRALVLANEEYQQVSKQLEEVLNDKKEIQIQVDEMKRKIEVAKATFAEEETNKLKMIESLKQEIAKTKSEFPDEETLKERGKEKILEYEKIKKKCETDALNWLQFFKNLEAEVVHNIVPQYREIRQQVTNTIVKHVEQLNNLEIPDQEELCEIK